MGQRLIHIRSPSFVGVILFLVSSLPILPPHESEIMKIMGKRVEENEWEWSSWQLLRITRRESNKGRSVHPHRCPRSEVLLSTKKETDGCNAKREMRYQRIYRDIFHSIRKKNDLNLFIQVCQVMRFGHLYSWYNPFVRSFFLKCRIKHSTWFFHFLPLFFSIPNICCHKLHQFRQYYYIFEVGIQVEMEEVVCCYSTDRINKWISQVCLWSLKQ